MTLQVNGTTVINLNRSITLGTATPGSPTTGLIRWNSNLSQFEVYNGTAWVNVIAGFESNPLWTWGTSNYGQLGDNTTTSRSSPVSVVGGFTDWVQISVSSHASGIRANGTAWTWGRNFLGQLGDNTVVSKSSPVSVVGGFTDWTQISVGSSSARHTGAIRANGTAWCWGYNLLGRLGDNTVVNKSSPVSVVGGFTDWTQISVGFVHTAAIRSNGTAWAWGGNSFGYLGNNSTSNSSSPVSVVGGFTDWTQISAGHANVTALRANSTVWTWGRNNYGQLGDNSVVDKSSPVSVVGGFTDWIQISSGYRHVSVLRTNGTAWAWGYNGQGRLGNNSTIDRSSPVSVVGGFTDWIQISSGHSHTIAIRANGTVWAWGANNLGQLGNNSTTSRSSPVSVVGGFTDWVQVSAGRNITAALRAV